MPFDEAIGDGLCSRGRGAPLLAGGLTRPLRLSMEIGGYGSTADDGLGDVDEDECVLCGPMPEGELRGLVRGAGW